MFFKKTPSYVLSCMSYLCALLLMSVSASADPAKLGVNGEGFFNRLTQKDITWLSTLQRTIVIRIPGGSSSKFAHPKRPTAGETIKGWNTNLDEIDAYFNSYLPNDPGETWDGPDGTCAGPVGASCSSNYCNKSQTSLQNTYTEIVTNYFDEQACDTASQLDGSGTCNYLEKIVYLHNLLNLEVVFNYSVMNGMPDELVDAISYLHENGVTVAGIEMGNEPYFKPNFNFNYQCYQDRFLPAVTAVKQVYPEIKTTIASDNFTSGEDLNEPIPGEWNYEVKNFLDSPDNKFVLGNMEYKYVDGIVLHHYLTQSACPTAWSLIPDYPGDEGFYNVSQSYFDSWESALTELKNCANFQSSFSNELSAAADYYGPDVPLFVTEFNIKLPTDFGNTLTQASYVFDNLLKNEDRANILLVQSGITSGLFGLFSGYQPMVDGSNQAHLGLSPDQQTTDYNVRRLGYWAMKLALKAQDNNATRMVDSAEVLNLTQAGTSVYYFVNLGDAYVPKVTVPAGATFTTNVQYVSGSNLYTSAGAASWNWKYHCASEQTHTPRDDLSIYSISNSSTNLIPKNSFGIITYSVHAN